MRTSTARRVLTFALVLPALAACDGRGKCERLAKRLMPEPTRDFIDQCVDRLGDPKFVKTADCLLAVQGGVYEADLERCGRENLPLYFHF